MHRKESNQIKIDRAKEQCYCSLHSGAGANLKVGAQVRGKAPGIFCCCAPPLFWLYKYK